MLDAIEDAYSAEPGEPQLEPEPTGQRVAHRAASLEVCARDGHAAFDRAHPGRGYTTLRQFRFGRASLDLFVARHVEPTRAPVAAELLPEIRQLQRRAQRVRGSIERLAAIAGSPEHESPDRIGRSAAVVENVWPRGVP